MTEMAVIVPTRGRRKEVQRLLRAWAMTYAQADLYLAIDSDDTDTYTGLLVPESTTVCVNARTSMCGALNRVATQIASEYLIVGFMGDDHLPRTVLWDQVLRATMRDGAPGPAIAYGNDLIQGELLPTAVFMSSAIIEGLGYMAPPGIEHLFPDIVWRDWGEALGPGHYHYIPQVIIEHMHPLVGKAEWDEGHRRVNSNDQWNRDELAYAEYRAEALPSDIAKLRALF